MKVSIITVVYNNAATIATSIESVLNQNYEDIEYIVVDGQSTDGTQDIIQQYANDIQVFISEEDEGLYDALNKGMALASGDVIGILHADDIFYSKNSVAEVVKGFRDNKTDCIYGDLVYVERENTDAIIRNWKSGEYECSKFLNGWMPPHPTFYIRKTCYQQYGGYDTAFNCSADYEFMLRYLYKNKIEAGYVNKTLVKMRIGGISNSTLKGRLKANREDVLAWEKNNISPNPLLRIMKPLRKIGQINLPEVGFKWATYLALLIPFIALMSGLIDNMQNIASGIIVGLSSVFAWGIVGVSVPVVIKIAEIKHLMDQPNHRSSHVKPIPTLGGIAIFASILLSLTIWGGINELNHLQYVIGALTIIFFIGVKDDMLVISPKKKFIAQIIASMLIIHGLGIEVQSFYGVLGVNEISPWFGVPFTILTFILITNAYNLIDGIDGLASSLGMFTACFFGSWFLSAGFINEAILAFSLVGGLAAFIKFNFSKNNKIFLGDTGSLIIGTLSATMIFQFLKLNGEVINTPYYLENGPIVVMGVIGVPLFDVIRLFILRIIRGQSPFSPDRNHIHHLLIDLNFSHRNATIIIGILNVLMIATALFFFTMLDPTVSFLLLTLSFLFHIVLCHQLQFSSHRVVKLLFVKYIRLLNGKRVVKPSIRSSYSNSK
ncbi:UDP-N-acetylmuramyl pentapeptide phosphotransferase/UDP-N-acetylglucosamine-1-phosphate transferase/glycosyltransferase involved in cell wall biosynthesis [Catalinimonas alkaloidigena]|uniref:glycosyltransferase n=1 Tax=Catalinimonas alkaloidigena TaxID=1075417 RepID=UPI0030B8E573|nr:UDP-N-acetylmuramyl pentapeptide phosphotransferase/UDP-N-acetylglucosamine-1-phosphate transferase/glycosyltransferase involved in cell wall biosynthesis [Catalinimonas alkaloidigena]